MKKWLKAIASILVIFIVVVITAVVLLITVVDPNRFKPLIADQVQKRLGRQLTLEGDLSWTVYPYLGVKVGHTVLSNPPGFTQKNFAELDSATFGVKLFPLLSKKFESSGITLSGLKLNLVKNTSGKTNWEDLKQKDAENTSTPNPVFAIAITGIDIQDAEINLIDEQTKKQWVIHQFNFTARDISLDRPFTMNAKFHFSDKADLSGNMMIETHAMLNMSKQRYEFRKSEISANLTQGANHLKLISHATVVVDGQSQQAELQDWHGKLADVDWTGQLTIKNLFEQPVAVGSIQLQPFALHDFGQLKASNVKSNFDFKFESAKKAASALQKLSLNGLVRADNLQAQKIKASQVMTKVQLMNGVLNFSPISAVAYEGNLQGAVSVNLNNPVLPVTADTKIMNVQTESLISDLTSGSSLLNIKGRGNLDLHLTTVGSSEAIRNLNGNGKFSFDSGTLTGIDIAYWANAANALIKKKPAPGKDTGQTQFAALTGTMNIQNGVISNNDLLMKMPLYNASGKGTLDLVNQKINYSLGIKAKMDVEGEKSDLLHLYGVSIPLSVTGNFNHPVISLDMNELMKQVTKEQINKVTDKVMDQLKTQIPEGEKVLQDLLGR